MSGAYECTTQSERERVARRVTKTEDREGEQSVDGREGKGIASRVPKDWAMAGGANRRDG